MVPFLKQLYDSRGFLYTAKYTDVFIRNVIIDLFNSDIGEGADQSSGTRLSGSSAGLELGVNKLQRGNQPILSDFHPTSRKPPPIDGIFSRAIFEPLPNVYPLGVHSRISDLVKY